MEKPVLTNKEEFPTEEVVFSHLGDTRDLWISFFDSLDALHPQLLREWRYYNDGKSWLMKITHKKKTVFWLSVIEGAFRVTCYLGDKAEAAVLESPLSKELKERFTTGRKFGKIRGLTIVFKEKKDIEEALKLIPLRIKY